MLLLVWKSTITCGSQASDTFFKYNMIEQFKLDLPRKWQEGVPIGMYVVMFDRNKR